MSLAVTAPLWAALCALCASVTLPVYAASDIAESLNAIRSRGCEGHPGVAVPLRKSASLDEVAREWSRGGRLRDAVARTDYRMVNSSSMFVEGTDNIAAIVRTLTQNYCEVIVDATFTEIGTHRQQNKTWVVVAKPFEAPSPGAANQISARALELVNAARARARKCGSTAFPAVPPLKLDPLLQRAALAHAQDMAQHSRFDHEGSDGSRPAQRATRAGYRWRNVGENIAAGAPDVESVVQGWLDSPGHCANIMSPQFKEMGIAYVSDAKSKADIYWAQVFGTKR
jgi:uncharacterized protein YkwD